MRLATVQDFSHPYSKRNKRIMQKVNRHNLSQQSNSKSPNSAGRRPVMHHASISHIPEIDDIKGKNQLILGKERIDKIKYSLDIQETSIRNFERRMKKGQQYIKYQQQAIDIKKPSDIEAIHNIFQSKMEGESKLSNKQITEAIHHLKGKNIFQEIKKRVDNTEYRVRQTLRSLKLIQKSPKKTMSIVQKDSQLSFDVAHRDRQKSDKLSIYDEFDNIITLKEDSFFQKRIENQGLNIFKFLFNPKDKSFLPGRDKLAAYNFNFDSICTMSNKTVNENINTALSTYSRISATMGASDSLSIPQDFKMKDSQIIIDPLNVGFSDIMLISKGLIMPNQLTSVKETNDKALDLQDSALLDITNNNTKYHKGKEKSTNIMTQGLDKTEHMYYKKVPLKYEEKRQLQLAQKYLQKMKQIIDSQNQCIDQTIYDKSIKRLFEAQKSKLLDAQSNKNIFKTPAEKEKMIRIGKINKDKCEHIKIDSINRSIRLLKEQKKQLQIHSQSKSKSNKKNQDKSTPKFSKFNNLNKV